LKDFFNAVAGANPTPALVAEFLSLDHFSAVSVVLKYKSALLEKGLAEATINRRLASVKALADSRLDKCDRSLNGIG
jgi:integrase/recombinase XerC